MQLNIQQVSTTWISTRIYSVDYFKLRQLNHGDYRMECINNSHHLALKYARIFVRGHNLFREGNGFPRAQLEENCELSRQMEAFAFIILQIFFTTRAVLKIEECSWNIRSRNVIRPIARERKYSMHYNTYHIYYRILIYIFYKIKMSTTNRLPLRVSSVCSRRT